MKRKLTVFIAAASPFAIVLIAAGCGSSTGGSASLLGITRRANGGQQVTYAGHPLYRLVEDRKPGQTKGEGSHAFGTGWEVLSPAGKKIESDG